MKNNSSINTWVFRPKPNPQARLRLFCLPYAGGGASMFRTWPAHLPSDIEVWAIRLPGRENRLSESPFTHLSPLLQTLIDVLRPHLNIPFALFGHSMGATISFELARRLRREKLTGPVHLFISGRQAPQMPRSMPIIHHLPRTEFIDELRVYQGIPEVVFQEAELMELLLPVIRADFTLVETYVHTAEDTLTCPISAFAGQEDETTPIDEVDLWRTQTSGRFTMRVYPGDHFFLRDVETSLLQAITHDLTAG